MRFEDIKVGMILRTNDAYNSMFKGSDCKYTVVVQSIDNRYQDFVGKVIDHTKKIQ